MEVEISVRFYDKIGKRKGNCMNITISEQLQHVYPQIQLGILHYKGKVEPTSGALLEEFTTTIETLSAIPVQEISQIPAIQDTRAAYHAFGKNPSKYRNAAEAMRRRISQGKGLYQINNVIDLQNLMSITSGYSIGSYDCAKLSGDVYLALAQENEQYEGIGKDAIHITSLPVLYDALGPFGNPTSDSQRAMICTDTTEILTVIYCFSDDHLQAILDSYQDHLHKDLHVTDIHTEIISTS